MPTLYPELRSILEKADVEHARAPHESFVDYRQRRLGEIEQVATARQKVYLDMNFWIALRDPSKARKPLAALQLRELLLKGVGDSRLLCPVSYALFLELMKQYPMEQRLAQAALMDKLSEGVGIRNPFDTAEIEYLRLMVRHNAALEGMPIDPVWTPIGHLIGEMYGGSDALSHELLERFRKVSFDVARATRMAHLAERMEGMPARPATTASRINAERQRNLRGTQSFDKLFSDELDGLLDVMSPHIGNSLKDAAHFVGIELTDEPLDEQERRNWIRLLRESVRRDAAAEILRSERVGAALHAAIRLDDNHLFEQNDLADIGHCSVAVAYCDVFLTERKFAHMLRLPAVQKVIPRGCAVISSIDEAIAILS